LGNLLNLPKEIKVGGLEGRASFMMETLYEIDTDIDLERGRITKELTNENEKL